MKGKKIYSENTAMRKSVFFVLFFCLTLDVVYNALSCLCYLYFFNFLYYIIRVPTWRALSYLTLFNKYIIEKLA